MGKKKLEFLSFQLCIDMTGVLVFFLFVFMCVWCFMLLTPSF